MTQQTPFEKSFMESYRFDVTFAQVNEVTYFTNCSCFYST